MRSLSSCFGPLATYFLTVYVSMRIERSRALSKFWKKSALGYAFNVIR